MKKILFLIVVPAIILGNDGWITGARAGSGQFYATTEHPAISMDQELLSYDPITAGGIDIFYKLSNSSIKKVKLHAAFPVEFVIPVTYNKNRTKVTIDTNHGDISGDAGAAGVLKMLNKSTPNLKRNITLGLKPFLKLNHNPVKSFTIKHLNKKVNITDVVIERKLEPKQIRLIFHFKHQLTFPPKSSSTLSVRYDIDTQKSGDVVGQEYHLSYLLGSAKGWKGPIKKIYLLLPKVGDRSFFSESVKKTTLKYPEGFNVIGSDHYRVLLYRENYEPKKEDRIEVTVATQSNTPDFMTRYDPPRFFPVDKTVKVAEQTKLSKHFLKHILKVDYFAIPPDQSINARTLKQLKDHIKQGKETYLKLPKKLLMHLTRWELKLLRNSYAAREGYSFKSDRLTKHFKQFKWYKPKEKRFKLKLHPEKMKITRRIYEVEQLKK